MQINIRATDSQRQGTAIIVHTKYGYRRAGTACREQRRRGRENAVREDKFVGGGRGETETAAF
jgi:hypothetical protein